MASVKDPVCGMTINGESAKARREMKGQTYYFCSSDCATTFDKDPRRYTPPAPAHALPKHTPTNTPNAELDQ